MKLKPIGKNVAVVRIKDNNVTDTGIVLSKSIDGIDRAKAIAIGPEVTEVQVNDTLLVNWNKASMNKFDGIPIYMISQDEVIAVYEPT